MGLDMYLIRRKYVGANYEHNGVKGKIEIEVRSKKLPVEFNRVTYIDEDACYWRKANAIHKWFVDNVQDGEDNCRSYYVPTNKLEELLKLCKQVRDTAILKEGKIKNGETLKDGKWEPIMADGKYIENAEDIKELLPTTDGFFFGNTDYNEYYLDDINYTIEKLERILEEEKKLNDAGFYSDFEYRSSW